MTDVPGAEPDAPDLTGRLLVAAPPLGDPNFDRTVVLLLDHSPAGALGVILNRPTQVAVEEILPVWAEAAGLSPPGTVFSGGPVSPGALIGLARPRGGDGHPHGWKGVLQGVGTVDLSIPPDDQPVPLEALRLFAGYAGWAPDQLEGEIEARAWVVVDALGSDVFAPGPERLWHDALRRQGGTLAMLAGYPPHPSVN